MTDEKKPHEPILLPEDKAEQKAKPPYLLIALVLFGVLGAFWKMTIRKDAPIEAVKKQADIHKKLAN